MMFDGKNAFNRLQIVYSIYILWSVYAMTICTADISLDKYNSTNPSLIENDSFLRNDYVLTTPKIITSSKPESRYEQGLEDYEEAVARIDNMKQSQRQESVLGTVNTLFTLFSSINSAWNNVTTPQSDKSQIKSGMLEESSGDGTSSEFDVSDDLATEGDSDYNTESPMENGSNRMGKELSLDANADESEGRAYIKGDPLNGYYDFIITEGSYKFWAIFQLFTAGLMIYSTFAAIYYSKVNPIVSDYDYVSYLGGSRGLADDPEVNDSVISSQISSIFNGHWIQTAAHGFQFAMDAIDKIPVTRKK